MTRDICLGRIVRTSINTTNTYTEETGLLEVPAIVTAVHGDDYLDLTVFTPGGMFFAQRVAYGFGINRWHWPPRVAENKKEPANSAAATEGAKL